VVPELPPRSPHPQCHRAALGADQGFDCLLTR
jgi:hypothetical protein